MSNQWEKAEQFLVAYSATTMLDIVSERVSPEWAICIALLVLLYIYDNAH